MNTNLCINTHGVIGPKIRVGQKWISDYELIDWGNKSLYKEVVQIVDGIVLWKTPTNETGADKKHIFRYFNTLINS